MQVKEDLRVIKTKKALAEAFVRLLNSRKLDDITINELCEEAGVRRATFYKHYDDKYSFITAYTTSLRGVFERDIWKSDTPGATKDYYVEYAKRLVMFISEHSAEIDNIYKSSLFPSVLSIIVDQNYQDTCERLRYSQEHGMQLSASVEVTASMCTGGVAQTVHNWLRSDRELSADELANQIGDVVAAAIEKK